MTSELCIRSIPIAAPDGRTLSGLAVPYGKWSREISDGLGRSFTERIQAGAFRDSLSEDIKLFFNHDMRMPLARTRSGSLTIEERSTGIHFSAELPDTTLGNDVRVLMQRGDLSGEMSFGFYVDAEEWNAKRTQRTVTRGRLVELSVVTDAAYGDKTYSSLRSVSAAVSEAVVARLELFHARIGNA